MTVQGDNVLLRCGGDKDINLWWKTLNPGFDLFNKNISKTDKDYMYITGYYNLNIRNISFKDAIQYQCEDRNNRDDFAEPHIILFDKINYFKKNLTELKKLR